MYLSLLERCKLHSKFVVYCVPVLEQKTDMYNIEINSVWSDQWHFQAYSGCVDLDICRHVYETFQRYVLRYVLRYNIGKKLGTSYVLWCVSMISTEYLSYDVLTTSQHSYFTGVSWFRKASRNRLKTKMCPKTYLGHVLVLR
jgi:hypothetical protein